VPTLRRASIPSPPISTPSPPLTSHISKLPLIIEVGNRQTARSATTELERAVEIFHWVPARQTLRLSGQHQNFAPSGRKAAQVASLIPAFADDD
jgi:hypothetical protein